MEYDINRIETSVDMIFYLMYNERYFDNIKINNDLYIRCFHVNDKKNMVRFKDYKLFYKDNLVGYIMTTHSIENEIFTYYIQIFDLSFYNLKLRELLEFIEKGVDNVKTWFSLYKHFRVDYAVEYIEMEITK